MKREETAMLKPTRRSVIRGSLGVIAAGAVARPYLANAETTTAAVWWVQSFAEEEDLSFKKLVTDYETNHIWRQLVEKAGYSMEDIPKSWDAFRRAKKVARAGSEERL